MVQEKESMRLRYNLNGEKMENNIITKENFEQTKSLLTQINDFAAKNNENLQLYNQKIQNTTDLVTKVGDIFIESKRITNDNLKLKNELATIVADFKNELPRGRASRYRVTQKTTVTDFC